MLILIECVVCGLVGLVSLAGILVTTVSGICLSVSIGVYRLSSVLIEREIFGA